MCKLFVGADRSNWEAHTHSLRIDGVSTSIRIENFYWSVLEEIAERDGMTLNALITRLYTESVEAGHDMGSFASFLRVCCGRYLALQLAGDVPSALDVPIRSLDADRVLERERASAARRRAQSARLQSTG